jgi:putative oxidoreductase
LENIGKLILRVAMGGMMLTHGWPKVEKLLAGGEIKFADPLGLGPEISLVLVVFAEFVCSMLIILGFKTKLASIPLIITMLVAAFIAHGDDPFSSKEKALMYAVAFLAIGLIGSGKYSVDYRTDKYQQ